MEELHISVLLKEAIEELKLRDNSIIVDATLGYGGHSSNILDRIKKGFLFAFDQDSEAINHSTNRLKPIGANFTIIKNNFVNLKKELNDRKIDKVDGILFDLGVSSPELDEDYRGFSYHKDAYLDMRMDQEAKLTAHDVVNKYDINKLTDIFRRYGEDKFARNIAKKIVEAREIKEIDTTLELVEIIKTATPSYDKLTSKLISAFEEQRKNVKTVVENKTLNYIAKPSEKIRVPEVKQGNNDIKVPPQNVTFSPQINLNMGGVVIKNEADVEKVAELSKQKIIKNLMTYVQTTN